VGTASATKFVAGAPGTNKGTLDIVCTVTNPRTGASVTSQTHWVGTI
jgi:hypothetical protein